MKIAIIDDEKYHSDILNTVLCNEIEKLQMEYFYIDTYSSGEEFLKDWTPGKYNLIFLDIYMNGINGIDVARKIREMDETVEIVFCTTSNDFAAQSYEVNAKYYLKKPVDEESIDRMLGTLNLKKINRNQYITLPDGNIFKLYSLVCAMMVDSMCVFKFKDFPDITAKISLLQAEEILLRFDDFLKINRYSIVNLNMVEQFTKESIYMSDGTEILIPRRKYKDIVSAYSRFRIRKMKFEKF